MKFIIGKEEKSTQTITFYKPGDFGKLDKIDFDVTFKLLSVERFKEIEGDMETDDLSLMKEIITDINGVFDEKGNEIAFSDELLEAVMDDVHAKLALMEKFVLLHTKQGRKDARRKN